MHTTICLCEEMLDFQCDIFVSFNIIPVSALKAFTI